MKYRAKPVVIDAIQFNPPPSEIGQVYLFKFNGEYKRFGIESQGGISVIRIYTYEGIMTATPGDWIIRGVTGEFSCCKPDAFAATYEPAL